jgi:Glycosyltransferases, probably involved in cell wall biogenesis
MQATTALLWSLPWIVPPIVAAIRSRRSRSLDDVSPEITDPAPLVSIIVPARNERRNIERCVSSLLAARYPSFEVIVVDDHSSDGTGDLARAFAARDDRVRVVDSPELPEGWFGKQWACATAAGIARGDLLLFTDADTRHEPDLLPRAVNALLADRADLVTIAGAQEMHGFWERIIQPQLFVMLATRFGGTEDVSNARRAADVIANGQFILVRRDSYDAVGGHAIVRDRVAEDLALAQEFFRAGRRILLLLAIHQLSTRMYTSLAELIAGWRKNIFAGGRYAVLGGAAGRALFPAFLIAIPVAGLLPPIALLLSVIGVLSASWLLWSAVVVGATLVFWLAIYRMLELPVWYALLYPLGLAALLYISAGAVVRGSRVSWKGRTYTSA